MKLMEGLVNVASITETPSTRHGYWGSAMGQLFGGATITESSDAMAIRMVNGLKKEIFLFGVSLHWVLTRTEYPQANDSIPVTAKKNLLPTFKDDENKPNWGPIRLAY